MADEQFILAIDQGTTSSRAIVFNHDGRVVSSRQLEHEQIFPRAGWVEHDPAEIWGNVRTLIAGALEAADLTPERLAAVGITNQRETTVVWNRTTGECVYNAIVWQDTRTAKIVEELGGGDQNKYRSRTGLPLATYFCGPKVRWILDNVDGAREAAEAGELVMGTIDSWLLWNLTGGVDGGVHLTDVTNASRTLMMDLRSRQWDEGICSDLGIPMSMLPEIRSCSEVFGEGAADGPLPGVAISGILGDQHAATFGQACFERGQVKNTYGTGCFIVMNTGTEIVDSTHGLLTVPIYQLGDGDCVYGLEGSIAVAGSLVQWLRDNLGVISEASEIEGLAASVDDNGGAYFVPAFSGLFAPHWRDDARGVLVGLTRYVNKGHLARAALEATAFQTREVLEAMEADSGVTVAELKVDGGMTGNEPLMQFQADQAAVPVVRPVVAETTALGAAYAAGIAVGFWGGIDEVAANWDEERRWTPEVDDEERERQFRNWKKAVTRTFGWVDDDVL